MERIVVIYVNPSYKKFCSANTIVTGMETFEVILETSLLTFSVHTIRKTPFTFITGDAKNGRMPSVFSKKGSTVFYGNCIIAGTVSGKRSLRSLTEEEQLLIMGQKQNALFPDGTRHTCIVID